MMVMVVDAGGGTTDVTVHEVHEVGGQAVLKEAVRTKGALCGGVLVDEAFRWVGGMDFHCPEG
jgi:molecular chaperone DnaK (HSP70)